MIRMCNPCEMGESRRSNFRRLVSHRTERTERAPFCSSNGSKGPFCSSFGPFCSSLGRPPNLRHANSRAIHRTAKPRHKFAIHRKLILRGKHTTLLLLLWLNTAIMTTPHAIDPSKASKLLGIRHGFKGHVGQ